MSMLFFVVLLSFLSFNTVDAVAAIAGTVQLDEYTFNKLIDKFTVTLVKFDEAFPYGDKHDAYVALGELSKSVDEILIAEVGVKDYGERSNEKLAKKYGIEKKDFPAIRLFIKGVESPVIYSGPVETDRLKQFIRDQTGIRLTPKGCLLSFDKIAYKFELKDSEEEKKLLIKEAEEITTTLKTEEDKLTGRIYISIMNKILEEGSNFLAKEEMRVRKLLQGKLNESKRIQLENKINILQSFDAASNKIVKSSKNMGEKNEF